MADHPPERVDPFLKALERRGRVQTRIIEAVSDLSRARAMQSILSHFSTDMLEEVADRLEKLKPNQGELND